MAMHPTRRQSNFYLSLKKRILDYSQSGDVVPYFSSLSDVPKDFTTGLKANKWVVVEVGDKVGEDIVEQLIHLHLFTKKDVEFDNLMALEDTAMSWFMDHHGNLVGFDLYDTDQDPWVKIGGVLVYQDLVSDTSEFQGGVKFKTITLTCKWVAR